MAAVGLIALAAGGCGKAVRGAPAEEATPPNTSNNAPAGTAPAGPPAAIDPRTPQELASAIDAAAQLPLEEQTARYDEVRGSWLGTRLRWTTWAVPQLCRNKRDCTVSAFDRAGADTRIRQSWRPRLHLDDQAMGALRTGCGGAPLCVVRFEGTLDKLVLNPDAFPAIAFDDVRIVSSKPDPRMPGAPHAQR